MGNNFIKIILFIVIFTLFFVNSYCEANKIKEFNSEWHMQSALLVSSSDENVSTSNLNDKNWYKVKIPTTVLTGLVKNGVYPDPYIDMNNMKIPDANDEFNSEYDLLKYSHIPGKNPWSAPYWFRTLFNLNGFSKGKKIWLNFDGINYRADIWINGEKVADAKNVVGMFSRFKFDITNYLKFKSNNILAVKIYPLDYPGLPAPEQLEAFGDFYANGGPTGDIGKNVTMQSSVGWDWIPPVRDRNIGIWQKVYLEETGDIDIRDTQVITDLPLPKTDYAYLTIRTFLVNTKKTSVNGILKGKIIDKSSNKSVLTFSKRHQVKGNTEKEIILTVNDIDDLKISNPKLWWPNGYGNPNLYDIELTFSILGRISDKDITTFGVREVSTQTFEIGGSIGREFYVNGKKIHLYGGAWVPDMMLNRDRKRLEDELMLIKNGNHNIVRIWGGGVTPSNDFFEICDKLGLLVWSDFWITGDCQATWDKGSRDWPIEGDVFLSNVKDTVKRIRNHPSLLVWVGGNEGYPRQELYIGMRNAVVELDGSRPFLPTSGATTPPDDWGLSYPDNSVTGAYTGGPYYWINPKEYFQKVRSGGDYLFKDEVGIPSVPEIDSLEKFIYDLTPDPNIPFPLNNVWGYHDACEGNGKYSLYHEAIIDRYGEPKSLKEYTKKAQFINAENYRAIFEAARSGLNRTGGIILWKTNAAWPSVIWQIYDWYLKPNAGYYYAKKACEPLHIQINDDKTIVVVNNKLEPYNNLNAKIIIFDKNINELRHNIIKVNVGAQSYSNISHLDDDALPEFYFVKLQLMDEAEKVLSDNFYWFAKDDNFSILNSLPKVDLNNVYNMECLNKYCTLSLDVSNNNLNSLAFFVDISLRRSSNSEEILPTFWSDNYMILMPGENRKLIAKFREKYIEGENLYLLIDGWNVKNKKIVIND